MSFLCKVNTSAKLYIRYGILTVNSFCSSRNYSKNSDSYYKVVKSKVRLEGCYHHFLFKIFTHLQRSWKFLCRWRKRKFRREPKLGTVCTHRKSILFTRVIRTRLAGIFNNGFIWFGNWTSHWFRFEGNFRIQFSLFVFIVEDYLVILGTWR